MNAGVIPQGLSPSGEVHSHATDANTRGMARTMAEQRSRVLTGKKRISINVSRRSQVVKCVNADTLPDSILLNKNCVNND